MSKPKNQKPKHQNKAVGYCRVASVAQTDTSQSFEAQKQLINEKAQEL